MDDRMDDRNDLGNETDLDTDTAMASFFGSAKDAVDRYTHCVLCGANLHFTHQTDFSRNLTQESAKCLECGVQIRSVLHKLQ
jgi:hypothetical protein